MQKYKTVSEFMDSLSQDKKAQVEALRNLIINSHAGLQEYIKWNAPSYALDGEHRITFNVMNKEGLVKLVLHMGVARKENKKGEPALQDTTGLIQWNSDIRGVLSFKDLNDIESKHDSIDSILKKWLAIKP